MLGLHRYESIVLLYISIKSRRDLMSFSDSDRTIHDAYFMIMNSTV